MYVYIYVLYVPANIGEIFPATALVFYGCIIHTWFTVKFITIGIEKNYTIKYKNINLKTSLTTLISNQISYYESHYTKKIWTIDIPLCIKLILEYTLNFVCEITFWILCLTLTCNTSYKNVQWNTFIKNLAGTKNCDIYVTASNARYSTK